MVGSVIETDGITVWVNGLDGCCLARFGRQGIDIHRSFAEQEAGLPQCLFCTHRATTGLDWGLFQKNMKDLYQINIPDRFMPTRLRTPA